MQIIRRFPPTRSLGPNTPRSPSTREDSFRSHSREQSIDDRTSISSISGTPSHSHWCTVCKNKVYFTCDGWKRHMKEHETCFPCNLCGPASTLGTDKKFSRKSNLATHLRESHGESGARADQCADQWKQTVPKKAFACGFCVAYFRTLQDQMNHIDNLHYKHSQDISGWDHNNVILGLLSQPDVKVAWQRELASNGLSVSDCTWQTSVVADLQNVLEMCQDSPEALAAEALRSTDQYKKVADENQSTSTLDPMDTDPNFLMAQPQYQTAQESTPTSSYYSGMQASNPLYSAQTLQSTPPTMMSGRSLGHSHARSLSSAMSDPFNDSQPVTPYQTNLMQQPNIMHAYQDSATFQPSSASANTGNMTNIPFPFQASENNNFREIGAWQKPEISDAPPTPSTSEFFDYQAYQANLTETPDPAMANAYPSTNNPFNPQNDASDRWRKFSYSDTQNKTSLSTSQDDDDEDDDESHFQTGYNYRPRSRRT